MRMARPYLRQISTMPKHRINHIFDVPIAHAQVERQRDEALVLAVSDRKIFQFVAIFVSVIRV
jgi:hypothetical protein